jgi:hypothetical protein
LSYGVLYAADSIETAFCESVIHENGLFSAATGRYEVPVAALNRTILTFEHPHLTKLPLVDLTDDNLKSMGLNGDLCATNAYDIPQRWAAAIHQAAPSSMGIKYPSRQRPGKTCYAIFCRSLLQAAKAHSLTRAQCVGLCRHFNVTPIAS